MHLVRHDFKRRAGSPLIVRPFSRLNAPDNADKQTFAEISDDKFRGLAPGDNVDKIGCLLAGVARTLYASVNGKSKRRNGGIVGSMPELPSKWLCLS
jgi:hypothetical protein